MRLKPYELKGTYLTSHSESPGATAAGYCGVDMTYDEVQNKRANNCNGHSGELIRRITRDDVPIS